MNRILFIHFEEEFLIAGVETFPGKFRQLAIRGTDKFWFYFFINEVNNKIDYGFEYKKGVAKNETGFVGDFMKQIILPNKNYQLFGYKNELVELFFGISEDLKEQYISALYADAAPYNESEAIPVMISFSDNIGKQSQASLLKYLVKRNFAPMQQSLPFPVIWANMFVKIPGKNIQKQVAVIEALSGNLNMSVLAVSQSTGIVRTHFKVFNDYGTDPAVHITANKIVTDANKLSGLLTNSEAIKQEVYLHFAIAEKLVWQMNNSSRPYINVNTSFADSPDVALNLTLSVEDIRRLTVLHIHQLSRFFEDNFLAYYNLNAENLDAVFLLGDTLAGDLSIKEFVRFGTQRIKSFRSSELPQVLRAMTNLQKQEPISAETILPTNKTAGKKLETNAEKPELTYGEIPVAANNEVKKIEIAKLKVGQEIILHTFDPTPGKGKAMQHLMYKGKNIFVVVASTRSLQKGDMISAIESFWIPGMPAQFEVVRNNESLGRFVTRPIKTMEIN